MENFLTVVQTTKSVETENAGWQVFRVDDLKSVLTAALHNFYIEVEVEDESGNQLSCNDIQTLFVLNCATLTPPSDDVPSDQNLLPILTFFTQSEVPWWQQLWGRRRRDVMENAFTQPGKEHQPSTSCQRAPQIISLQELLGENFQAISPKTVDIGNCVKDSVKLSSSKPLCPPAEVHNISTLSRDKRTNELVQKMLPVVSRCA